MRRLFAWEHLPLAVNVLNERLRRETVRVDRLVAKYKESRGADRKRAEIDLKVLRMFVRSLKAAIRVLEKEHRHIESVGNR